MLPQETIVAGMITQKYISFLQTQDVVTRYAHQTGHYVERRFGWDCHGVPVEFEIDKKLNITSTVDVAKLGIDKYNSECRAIVMRYSKEWEATVSRIGRWIDFENDYKTMNTSYMESVWWVFKQLYDKGQVYRGFKVRVLYREVKEVESLSKHAKGYLDAFRVMKQLKTL